jgi:hypothetical protein
LEETMIFLLALALLWQTGMSAKLIVPQALPEGVPLMCMVHSGMVTCVPNMPFARQQARISGLPVVEGAEKKWPCPLDPSSLCQDAPQPIAHEDSFFKRADGSACQSNDLMEANPVADSYVCIPAPEPVDVPAIQKKRKYPARDNENVCNDGDTLMMAGSGVTQYDYCEELHWTCQDPKRILETAENGADHWCRKVQP